MNKEQDFILHLISSSINNFVSPEPEDIDLEYLYNYSAQNQFDHIIYNHLKALGIHDENDPIMHSFHQRYGYAIRRDFIQDTELAEISEALSEQGIAHMPLKGSVVKKYYPLPELRRSGDIDLLIHNSDRKAADEILKSLGYECTISGRDVEDVYERDKTTIELHFKLTGDDDISTDFCSKVWEHSKLSEGSMYEMEPEYMYVYLLSHLRKHLLEAGGGGIKLILDFYVLNCSIDFDREKLDEYTEQAHIENLRKYAEALSEKWFGNSDSDDNNVLMLEDLILNSGTHGDYSTYVDMTLAGKGHKGNKALNLIHLMCPPLKIMRIKYPILEQHPILLPISWVWRVLDAQGEHAKAVIKSSLNGLSRSEVDRLARFCEDLSK